MKKKIVYFDMDGVLAAFNKGLGRTPDPKEKPPERLVKGFYRNLELVEGAKWVVNELLSDERFDVYIASKPTSNSAYCYSEKFEWVCEHFPELKSKMILTPNKNLLVGDYLVDDRPKEWSGFSGELIPFNPDNPVDSWSRVMRTLGDCNG